MTMQIQVVFNRFPAIADLLPAAMDHGLDATATVINDDATAACPVDTGAMKASIRKEKIEEGHYEVSVQKDEALAGEKTYALFVDSGTIHMRAEPFFSTACQAGANTLQAAALNGLG